MKKITFFLAMVGILAIACQSERMELAADMYAFVWENMGVTPEFKEEVLN